MDKKHYSELLQDPRWQKKRLEILQRDNFTCQCCGSKVNTLQIHHLYYDKNLKPWEYSDEALITFCADCHEFETNSSRGLYQTYKDFIDAFRKAGFSASLIDNILSQLCAFAGGYDEYCDDAKEFVYKVECGIQCIHDVKRLQELGVDVSDLIEHVDELKENINTAKYEKQ